MAAFFDAQKEQIARLNATFVIESCVIP